MPYKRTISITHNYKRVEIDIRTIQYVFIDHNSSEFYLSTGERYRTRFPLKKLEEALGDEFLKIHRNYLVAIRAIHSISDRVYLNNGEALVFAQRRKKELTDELRQRRQRLLDRFSATSDTHTEAEYHERYRSFDDLPIAFCDIEMVLDEGQNAVDWIFRYGNEALARLEKTPLEHLLGKSFSSVFPNMDEKWLKSYERAALFGQTLEIIDHSPEIDTDLDIICFPTIKGHCGCILLSVDEMRYAENPGDRQNARLRYLAKFLSKI